MRYMANSRPGDDVTPERLKQFFDESSFTSAAWDLVRHHVVVEYALKVGDVPGVVLFLEVDSPEQASAVLNELPAVQDGLIAFELEPVGKAMRL
jgi:hypothetical protein